MGSSRARRYLTVAPAIVSSLLAYRYFIDLPIYDYWDASCIGLQCRHADWKTQWTAYWDPFVDQRMLFPKITIALFSRLPLKSHLALDIVFCLGPIGILFRRKQVFSQANFPWLVLILWCMGSAVLATAARSARMYPPNSIYYAALVIWLVSTVPLWLLAYPNGASNGGYFPEASEIDHRQKVEIIGLKPVGAQCRTLRVKLQALKVWTR